MREEETGKKWKGKNGREGGRDEGKDGQGV